MKLSPLHDSRKTHNTQFSWQDLIITNTSGNYFKEQFIHLYLFCKVTHSNDLIICD